MILTSGVFDPLHAGHLAFFDRIHEVFGSQELWVSLSERSDRHLPLVPVMDRCALVGKVAGASVVTDRSLVDVIQAEGRNVQALVKGDEWSACLPPEVHAACEAHDIPTVFISGTRISSSSAILADYQRRLNAEKLAQLETWVSTQPAAKPWEPVTPFDFESRKAIEGPHAQIIKDAFKEDCRPLSVLDVGCGPGHLMRMLTELGVSCRGVDVNGPSNWKTEDRIWQLDIAAGRSADWVEEMEIDYLRSDVVVCREVLEHIPVQLIPLAVSNLRKFAKRFIYVTTRFTSKPHLFDFDTSDDLDPTHITMLNQDYLRSLFVLEGCTRCPDLEAKLDHQRKGRVLVYKVPS